MSDMTALTWDDCVAPEEKGSGRAIDGEHYVTATPNLPTTTGITRSKLHQPPDAVWRAARRHHFEIRRVEPDLQYPNARAPELLSGNWVTGAPDLVVEIDRRHAEA